MQEYRSLRAAHRPTPIRRRGGPPSHRGLITYMIVLHGQLQLRLQIHQAACTAAGASPRQTAPARPASGAAAMLAGVCVRVLALQLALTIAAIAAAAAASPPDHKKNKLSTWIARGALNGPMGNDTTQALAWVTAHKEQISSFSIIGYGPPGADNITGPKFNAAVQKLGIDTYMLWCVHAHWHLPLLAAFDAPVRCGSGTILTHCLHIHVLVRLQGRRLDEFLDARGRWTRGKLV